MVVVVWLFSAVVKSIAVLICVTGCAFFIAIKAHNFFSNSLPSDYVSKGNVIMCFVLFSVVHSCMKFKLCTRYDSIWEMMPFRWPLSIATAVHWNLICEQETTKTSMKCRRWFLATRRHTSFSLKITETSTRTFAMHAGWKNLRLRHYFPRSFLLWSTATKMESSYEI